MRRQWTQDPDALHAKAREAGLTVLRDLEDTDCGNRTFTVQDPWSVRWTFDTYPGN